MRHDGKTPGSGMGGSSFPWVDGKKEKPKHRERERGLGIQASWEQVFREGEAVDQHLRMKPFVVQGAG